MIFDFRIKTVPEGVRPVRAADNSRRPTAEQLMRKHRTRLFTFFALRLCHRTIWLGALGHRKIIQAMNFGACWNSTQSKDSLDSLSVSASVRVVRRAQADR